jgi:two-component system OmpR family sensor kinase
MNPAPEPTPTGGDTAPVRFGTDAPSGPFAPSGPYAASAPAGEAPTTARPDRPWNPPGAAPAPRPPAPGTRSRRRGLAGWSLRGRMLAGLLALLAGISLIIGVASVVALRSYLVGQLDHQLTSAAGRTLRGFGHGDGGPQPGQAEYTLTARLTSNAVLGDIVVLTPHGENQRREIQVAPLFTIPPDGPPVSRDLGSDLGRYRLVAATLADGTVAVTGLPLNNVSNTVFRLAAIITLVALAGLALAAFAGAAIVRLTLRPLHRMAAAARQVSTLPLDRGEVALAVRVPEEDTDPHTEVGQVGAALNSMLGHVSAALTARQESETRVRRFVADASHELRTPLAAIRGYAELSRRSQEPVPPDVAHAMARVESQAVRMTGLVEDLLLLASLDSGRPLEREPVDMSVLLVGAVSDAHAAGPDHKWRLDLPDEPVTVIGEAARLVQVVVNLLANARAHTPPGTTVQAGLTTSPADPGFAALTVVDDGPGIPEALLPEVFERFARGDSSRSRAAGSTGLGLSIVSAVVTAHQGTVRVESVPGRTAFTVRLPLAPAA